MHRPLTESDLLLHGPLQRIGRRIRLFAEIDSTNTYALAHAEELGDGAVVAAEVQTAGRGRARRRWLSPRGSSILLSILLLEPDGSPWVTHATMLAAVAAAEAVDAEANCRVSLRWPNDLMIAGKKLGGILAESTPLPTRPEQAQPRRALVIGIGLNCFQQPGHFGPALAEIATSLEIECAPPIDRPALAGRLVERLDAGLSQDPANPRTWTRLREAWTTRCEDLGARVTLVESACHHAGTVLEITENGDLLVQLDSGVRRRFEPTTTTRIR